MPKAEWGVKRTCPNCEARFYDMQREPIVCPECGAAFNVDDRGKVSATRERRAPVAAVAEAEALVDEELVDEDENADETLLGDEDEEEEEPAGPVLSDEAEEEDTVPYDEGIIDEGEDEDEAAAEDEDDLDDLDDVPGKDKGS